MSYIEIARARARATAETYAGKVDRIAAELLDVLRDVLGPERRLPKPRAAYARYGDHSVPVRDGETGRVAVTAHLTTAGTIKEYSARLTHGDLEPRLSSAVGPLRMDCSESLEEHPTLTYVLPLVIRLGLAEGRMDRRRARRIEARPAGAPSVGVSGRGHRRARPGQRFAAYVREERRSGAGGSVPGQDLLG